MGGSIFILPNGDEVVVTESYQGRYLKLPVEIKYTDIEREHKNKPMKDIWKNEKYKKHEEVINFYDNKTSSIFSAIQTSIIAEKKDWKEYEATKYYTGERANNCSYKTMLEVVLMEEEWSRRLFLKWEGGCHTVVPFSSITSLEDQIFEDILENGKEHFAKDPEDEEDWRRSFSLEFYSDVGDCIFLDFRDPADIGRKIVSARVVEFVETINRD